MMTDNAWARCQVLELITFITQARYPLLAPGSSDCTMGIIIIDSERPFEIMHMKVLHESEPFTIIAIS